MALPANANTGTVIGTFIDSAGDPVAGKVTFTPSPAKILDPIATTPVTILPKAVSAILDTDGSFSQVLLSNEDTDLQPSGWTYAVSFSFSTVGLTAVPGFSISVPVGGTVDLAVVAPMSAANGKVIVQGMPAGGSAGQVLAKASATSYDTAWIDAASGGGGGAVSSVNGHTGAVVLTKADVGLGSVANTADASKTFAASQITSGTMAAARLGTGTASSSTVLYGDGTWKTAPTGGGTGGAVDSVNGQTGTVVLAAADVGAVPTTRTVNGHALSANVTVTAADVSAVPTTRTVNGKALSANIALTASDVGALTGTGVSSVVSITQASYDALPSPDAATLYVIVG